MFETLMSKTFFLLTITLFVSYIGSLLSYKKMQTLIEIGEPQRIKTSFWTAVILNIAALILLMIFASKTPFNIILGLIFTLSSGYTLGIYGAGYGSETTKQAIAITAFATLLTCAIANLSGLDFSGLGKILNIALIGLILVGILRFFINIRGAAQRFIAAIGTLVFTGYLLYDFGRLAKAKADIAANTWEVATHFAISIYLDIINLLMYIMQLLSGSSHHS